MSPEQCFATLRERIPRTWKLTFASALVFGLAAHFYKLVNWLPNWDSLVFRYDAQDMLSLGRCFLSAACALSSYYDLPFFNGMLALLYLGCCAVCVTALFRLQTPVACVLTGGFIAAFPTITSTLIYSYVADGYALALLCACGAAACFARPGRGRFVLGVALLAFSLGVYQAYITVTILLLLACLLDGLLFAGDSARTSLQRAGRCLLGGVLSGVVYLLCLKGMLLISGTPLSDYQGIGRAHGLSVRYVLRACAKCIQRFVRFFCDPRAGVTTWSIANLLMLALLAVFVVLAARRRIGADWGRLALCLVYIAALPFGAAALYFLNPWLDYHNLMTMGYCVFYLAFVLFYERELPGFSAKNWCILLLSGVLLFQCVLLANVCWHKLQMAWEQSYGITIRMADRIEQADGALSCTKLAVLGELPDSEDYSSLLWLDMTGVTDGLVLRADDPLVNQSVLTATLNDYAHLDYTFATKEEKEALAALPAVQQMPCWPESGSVAVVGDTVVVRLSEGVDRYE